MADNAIDEAAPVKEEVNYLCCGCCCEIQVVKPITEITASSDQIKLDETDKQDLDVFISSLSTPPAGSKIVMDHGLMSVIVGKMRQPEIYVAGLSYQTRLQRKLEGDMAEMERARGMAFGKLRAKAKQLDANAVLNIKVDLEEVGQASVVYASGNAVQLDNSSNVGKLRIGGGGSGELNWAGHDVPPYMPWGDIDSTTDSTTVKPVEPLEVSMSRGEKN